MLILKWTKNKRYDIGWGYDRRTIQKPKSILIHTTNGNKGSSFESEADYIVNSNKISAHYLIGKEQDQIIEFLEPGEYRAWHAGAVNNQLYNNNNAIGVENHFALGDTWTVYQRASLTSLCKKLIDDFGITAIERHRKVAVPLGRKIDPSGFSDREFELWRATLFLSSELHKYLVIVEQVNIRKQPKIADNIAGVLTRGDIIESSVIKDDELGQTFGGTNKWIHVTHGQTKDGNDVSNLGFVHASTLRLL